MACILTDEQLCRDVISLSGLLQLMQSCMSGEMLYLFNQDIQHNQPPEQSAQQIVSAIMAYTGYNVTLVRLHY